MKIHIKFALIYILIICLNSCNNDESPSNSISFDANDIIQYLNKEGFSLETEVDTTMKYIEIRSMEEAINIAEQYKKSVERLQSFSTRAGGKEISLNCERFGGDLYIFDFSEDNLYVSFTSDYTISKPIIKETINVVLIGVSGPLEDMGLTFVRTTWDGRYNYLNIEATYRMGLLIDGNHMAGDIILQRNKATILNNKKVLWEHL